MRYLIRRSNPGDLSDIRTHVPNLEAQLDKPAENLQRTIVVPLSPVRSCAYTLTTQKTATGFAWVCHSIELVAENDEGLFALTDKFKVPRPSHLVRE